MPSPSVFDLSKSEKLQLVEDLWDDLAAASDDVPVQEWQKQELDRRNANLRHATLPLLTWEQLKNNVRNGYGR
jgi:putative addiction module component (TIGR02574 family)